MQVRGILAQFTFRRSRTEATAVATCLANPAVSIRSNSKSATGTQRIFHTQSIRGKVLGVGAVSARGTGKAINAVVCAALATRSAHSTRSRRLVVRWTGIYAASIRRMKILAASTLNAHPLRITSAAV